MARRSSTTKSESSKKDATEAKEAPVSTTTEAPPAEAKTNTAPEFDLSAFQAAAEAAAKEADTATGELALVEVEKVVAEYRKIDGAKGKAAAKTWLGEQMKAAMMSEPPRIEEARSYLQLQNSMSAGGSSGGSKAPADPTEAFVHLAATLRLAIGLLDAPEGVSDDWQAKAKALVDESQEAATAYRAWVTSDAEDKGDEPEASAVVKNAVKLALGKSAKPGGRASGGGGSFTGERRDIGKHIAEAFANEPSGTFKLVAEIRKFHSSEYGDNPPSAGAISARLFPKGGGETTVEGVRAGTDDEGHKGAYKL